MRDLRGVAFVGVDVPLAGGVPLLLVVVVVASSDMECLLLAEDGSRSSPQAPAPVHANDSGSDVGLAESEDFARTDVSDCRDEIDTEDETTRWPLLTGARRDANIRSWEDKCTVNRIKGLRDEALLVVGKSQQQILDVRQRVTHVQRTQVALAHELIAGRAHRRLAGGIRNRTGAGAHHLDVLVE